MCKSQKFSTFAPILKYYANFTSMNNHLYQSRQFAFWMGIVVLFRVLLHIPDAEGMLPAESLALLSSAMDIFLYALMLIYSGYLIVSWKEKTQGIKETLWMVVSAASVLIILHLVSWRYVGCDPDVHWEEGSWWFKIIYLYAYFQLSCMFIMLFVHISTTVHARWWALANAILGLPFILFLIFLLPLVPFLQQSFEFMLFKDLSMDIALTGFYWSLSNAPRQLEHE